MVSCRAATGAGARAASIGVTDACQLNLMSLRSSVILIPDRSGVRSWLRAWMCRLVGTTIPSKVPSLRM
jgi:hypothetical protein